MTEKTTINNNFFSITVLRKRLLALICAVTFIFSVIFVRSFVVTVVDGKDLREKAIDQWTRELPVKAVRGEIVDRNGVVLASDSSTFAVYVRTRCVTDAEKTA